MKSDGETVSERYDKNAWGEELPKENKPTRPPISERNKILVWARAAGRCTFCNTLVTEATSLGEPVPIGELAHNVGWSEGSPRGASPLSSQERAEASNLILACRNCHKPIDDGGVAGRYSTEELIRRKRDHETRIETLTAIGADRFAYVLRVVGDVRGVPAELAGPLCWPRQQPPAYTRRSSPGITGTRMSTSISATGAT